ncbi:MAG: 3'(2'),5'-bisphosphate nucleotidase CysQ [Prevotellaceae bacterium]|jgi:3'(2'), 5'-bisphosphate nucleotidase|nr:3'(2'),5'-bisphosphate nucleotidase CysQ [Prevotellaceae bacterium]
MLKDESMKMLFTSAINAAIRAGAKIMEVYESGDLHIKAKSDLTPLTLADTLAHDEIKSNLALTRIPVISEEGRSIAYDERSSWDLFWMVDPLDGTDEFINRTRDFTVNIALIQNGYPTIGIVYAPAYKRIYFAAKERGSYRKDNIIPDINAQFDYEDVIENSTKLPVHNTNNNNLIVVTSRLHISPDTSDYVNELRKKYPNITVIRRGSSLKMCMLAVGKADIYPRFDITWEWDTAASQIIAEEAGFAVSSVEDGTRLSYNKENMQNPWFVCKKAMKDIN